MRQVNTLRKCVGAVGVGVSVLFACQVMAKITIVNDTGTARTFTIEPRCIDSTCNNECENKCKAARDTCDKECENDHTGYDSIKKCKSEKCQAQFDICKKEPSTWKYEKALEVNIGANKEFTSFSIEPRTDTGYWSGCENLHGSTENAKVFVVSVSGIPTTVDYFSYYDDSDDNNKYKECQLRYVINKSNALELVQSKDCSGNVHWNAKI